VTMKRLLQHKIVFAPESTRICTVTGTAAFAQSELVERVKWICILCSLFFFCAHSQVTGFNAET